MVFDEFTTPGNYSDYDISGEEEKLYHRMMKFGYREEDKCKYLTVKKRTVNI